MKCPKCGAENAEGLTFCKQCWTSFRDRSESPSAPPDSEPKGEGGAAGRGPLFGVPYVSAPRESGGAPWSSAPGAGPPARRGAHDPEVFADRLRMEADVGPSPRSVLSLILGMLSVVLFCLLFLTVPIDLAAFVLGMLELREINRGAAPRAGRGFAAAGVILAGCALAVKLFIFLVRV